MNLKSVFIALQKTLNSEIAKRFVRAFIGGGLAAVLAAMEAGANILQPKAYVVIIVTAFLTGGFLAADKWIRQAIKEYLEYWKKREAEDEDASL